MFGSTREQVASLDEGWEAVITPKSEKTLYVMIILVFVVTYLSVLANCSSDYVEVRYPEHDHEHSQVHCGFDLNNFIPSEDRSSSSAGLASSRGLLSLITEPRLPILSFSVFKVPKPVQTASFV